MSGAVDFVWTGMAFGPPAFGYAPHPAQYIRRAARRSILSTEALQQKRTSISHNVLVLPSPRRLFSRPRRGGLEPYDHGDRHGCPDGHHRQPVQRRRRCSMLLLYRYGRFTKGHRTIARSMS